MKKTQTLNDIKWQTVLNSDVHLKASNKVKRKSDTHALIIFYRCYI